MKFKELYNLGFTLSEGSTIPDGSYIFIKEITDATLYLEKLHDGVGDLTFVWGVFSTRLKKSTFDFNAFEEKLCLYSALNLKYDNSDVYPIFGGSFEGKKSYSLLIEFFQNFTVNDYELPIKLP